MAYKKPEVYTKESWELELCRFEKLLEDMFGREGYVITHDGPIHGGIGYCGRPELEKEF